VIVERRARQTPEGERGQELLVVNAKENAEGRFARKREDGRRQDPNADVERERRKTNAGAGTEKASMR